MKLIVGLGNPGQAYRHTRHNLGFQVLDGLSEALGVSFSREKYRGHPAFEKTVDFCEKWDQAAFDPDYDTMPLTAFEPMVQRIFARDPWAARTKEP